MNKDKLVIVWLSCDKRAAFDMAMLYARDSLLAGWFSEVELILWGPSVNEAVTNENCKTQLELLQSVGVEINACLACARLYGVVEQLEQCHVPCLPMGERLTGYLKSCAPLFFI